MINIAEPRVRDHKEIQHCPRCMWGMYLAPGYVWLCGNAECRYVEKQLLDD